MITAADVQMIRIADPGVVLPGIDTMTSDPDTTSTLLDVTATQDGAVLSGINFGTATLVKALKALLFFPAGGVRSAGSGSHPLPRLLQPSQRSQRQALVLRSGQRHDSLRGRGRKRGASFQRPRLRFPNRGE